REPRCYSGAVSSSSDIPDTGVRKGVLYPGPLRCPKGVGMRYHDESLRWSLGIALVLMLGFGASAAAQTGQIYGEITGKVVDGQGGLLPGVTVTLTSPTLMGSKVTATSERGLYHFPFLPSGTYAIRFGLQGFRLLVREGLIVAARTTVTQDATLDVATVEETVTVTGESPVVDVTNTKMGSRLDSELLAAA